MRVWVLGAGLAIATFAGWGFAAETSEAPQGEGGLRSEPTLEGSQAVPAQQAVPDRQPGRTGKKAGSSQRDLAALPFDKSVFLKLAGGMAIVVAMAVGLLWVYRRWGGGNARLSTAGGLQVLGRTALSPKHFVYVLRLEERRIVVGVSGDRMTTLAVYEEPPLLGTPFAKRSDARSAARTESRVGKLKTETPSHPAPIREEEFVPYRRQVSRLRDMLRNHRGEPSDGKDSL